jgi:predicted dienelactone hydrolase
MVLVASLALVAPVPSFSQTLKDKIQLPHPSGRYGVARIAYDWVDHSRPEKFATTSDAHREIMVYVWYPTEPRVRGKMSEYQPYADEIAKKLSSKELEDEWGSSWRRVFSKQVLTDTHEKAPGSSGRERFPLLIFSPGAGMPATSYTTLLQEVVSRGYVIASIEPTYESPAVGFPDGRVIRSVPEASENRQIKPTESREQYLERMHTSEAPHLERLAADVRFVLDQLGRLAKRGNGAAPFAKRIDFENVGAWGHSIGGRVAARACQLDARIKACLNADGAGPDSPIFAYEKTTLLRQPFMWIEAEQMPPPTDQVLATYKITRQQWKAEHEARMAGYEEELRSCTGGSYRIAINIPGINHYSFTDWPLLEAKNKEDFEKGAKAIELLEEYVIAFFDKQLKRAPGAILDKRDTPSAGVAVIKYDPTLER